LREKGITFESFDLNNIPEGEEIYKKLRGMTRQKHMPYVFVEGTYIGGLPELKEEVRAGKLRRLKKSGLR
jgi:glutaredoxin